MTVPAPTSTPTHVDCIEWEGARTCAGGYGRRWVDGKMKRVHRLAWAEAYGPIPEGLHVLHRCDNPPCHNVDHLFLGTNGDNVRDCVAKGRHSNGQNQKTHCPQGHTYDEANTYYRSDGKRQCRACNRDRAREWQRKRRQSARAGSC